MQEFSFSEKHQAVEKRLKVLRNELMEPLRREKADILAQRIGQEVTVYGPKLPAVVLDTISGIVKSVTNRRVTIEAGFYQYTFPLDDIEIIWT